MTAQLATGQTPPVRPGHHGGETWRDAEPEYHIGAGRSDELFCALEVSNLNVERDEPQIVS